jgi:hypothetical protein
MLYRMHGAASLAVGYAQVVKQKAVEKARRTEHCRI